MKNGLFEKNRLEAFSDGVFAIIITIMVIEFHPPTGAAFSDLPPLVPKFFAYLLSFLYLAIYWNNHHHLLKAAKGINGGISKHGAAFLRNAHSIWNGGGLASITMQVRRLRSMVPY